MPKTKAKEKLSNAAPAKPEKKKRKWLRRCFSCLGIAIVLMAALGAVSNYYVEYKKSDEYILSHSTIPAEFKEIADKLELTDHGLATYYYSNPQFVDAETLDKHCKSTLELLLGCFISNEDGGGKNNTYVLNLANSELDIHKYATTAHEMLHGMYSRLSQEEKTELDKLIKAEYLKRSTDKDLQDIVESYKDAGYEIEDELHSRFGTEYTDLSPELEEHFKKVFKDRQDVVAFNNQYEAVFNKRLDRIAKLDKQAKGIFKQFKPLDARIKKAYANGNYTEGNRLVNQYNALVVKYNKLIKEINALYKEIEYLYKLIEPNYSPPSTETKKDSSYFLNSPRDLFRTNLF